MTAADLIAQILALDAERMEPRLKRGIYARTMLPCPTYDSCFEVVEREGRHYCQFKRDGSVGRAIADYVEEVPGP